MQRACAVPCSCSRIFKRGSWVFWSLCIFCPQFATTAHACAYLLVLCINSFFVFCCLRRSIGANFGQKISKNQKKTLLPLLKILKSQGQKLNVGSKSRVQCMPSALNPARGVGTTPKPFLCRTPGHTLTLTPHEKQARPPPESEQAKELLVCPYYSCYSCCCC